MIDSLSLQNFKDTTRAYRFARGNLIHGRSFSGKSAIMHAIAGLVIGHVPNVPGLAKKTTELKRFASGMPAALGATINSQSYTVAFDRVKGTVKMIEDKTMAAEIDEPTRVIFDPSIFFGLSESARISKACELARSKGLTPEQLDADLVREVSNDTTLLTYLGEWRKAVKPKAPTINDLLTTSEDWWKEKRKLASEEKTRMQKAVEAIADLSTFEAEKAKLPPKYEVEASKGEARATIDRLNKEIAAANALREHIATRAQRISQLTEAAGDVKPTDKYVDPDFEEATKLDEKQSSLVEAFRESYAALDNARRSLASSNARATRIQRLQGVVAGLEIAKREVVIAEARLAAIDKEIRQLDPEVRSKRTQLQAARENLKKLSAVPAKPTSAATSFEEEQPGVYRVAALVEKTADGVRIIDVPQWTEEDEEKRQELEAKQFEAESLVSELEDAVSNAESALDAARLERVDASDSLAQRRQTAADVETANSHLNELLSENVEQFTADKVATLEADYNRVSAELSTTKRRIEELAAKGQSAMRKWITSFEASKSLAALRAEVVKEPPTPADLEAMAQEVKLKTEALASHDAMLQTIQRFANDQIRIDSAVAERAKAESLHKKIGGILDVISQKKTELVSGSIVAPLAIANKLAKGILKGDLVFEGGEIGMRVGENFISSVLFSGTESAIVTAGLSAGLASKAKVRVLMIDEIGKMDAGYGAQLIKNLLKLVEDGDIDQFLVFGPTNEELIAGLPADPELLLIEV